jgi:succinylarginine dihydrolase
MIPIGYEVNFDGLTGPTHNYSGLAYGNIASMTHREETSNPRAAALQGLEKMKILASLGIKQAVLPPHERPHLPSFRALGFTGPARTLPEKVFKENPRILSFFSSAAPMWTANSATITPSIDSIDQKVHITPANMFATPHRAYESDFNSKILKLVFADSVYFRHHPPLPAAEFFSDEGAANYSRFCKGYTQQGISLFVYGKSSFDGRVKSPQKFPARQTFEASKAIVRSHNFFPERVIIAQQNPEVIDQGVFHNDVISVSNQSLFFYHEEAFTNTKTIVADIRNGLEKFCDIFLRTVEVPAAKISVKMAVKTYLFNSQIITLPNGGMSMIAPLECQKEENVALFLDKLTKDPESPIRDVLYFDLNESMRNGGGPACLRIRAVLTQNEFNGIHSNIILTEKLYNRLTVWVSKHYRDRLSPKDLIDPNLIDETQSALDELTKILDLGSIYSFQRQ